MNNRLRVPLVALILLFAFIPVFPQGHPEQQPDKSTHSKGGKVDWPDWSRVPDWAVAAFTLGLLVVSACQWKAMVSATRETKRSVDTLIESERGRMIFWGGHYDTKTKKVHWGYKNIGRGPAIILADSHITKHYGEFDKPPLHDTKRPQEDRKWGIMSDDVLATWPGKSGHALLETCEYDLSAAQIAEVGKSIQLILKGQVVYETHLGQKYRRFFAVSFHPPIEGDDRCVQGMYGGEEYNYEEEIK